MIVGDNDERYRTPFILRTGFLHSYERTLPVIIGWLVLNIVIYWQMNVLDHIMGDVWTYLYIPLFVVAIHIARMAVRGYDDLFDVLDKEFEEKLKLYTSLNLPPKTENQKRIRDIFINEDTTGFKKQVRKLLFSGADWIFVGAIVLAKREL